VRPLPLALVVLAGCAHPARPPAAVDVPSEAPRDQTRHYTIWLGGARVGTATESEQWSSTGVRLVRDEQLKFLRGDALVQLATTIEIDADVELTARRVRWTETGSETRAAEAVRRADGSWRVSTGAALATPAVPAELVPLLVRRDGRFAGSLFLPARGFVTGTGRIEPIAEAACPATARSCDRNVRLCRTAQPPRRECGGDRLVARLVLDAGAVVEATIDLDADGAPSRVVDGEGVIAIRASELSARDPFPAVDLIAATSIAIAGTPRAPRAQLVLDGELALPALPGQRTHAATGGVAIELSTALPGELPPGAATPDRIGDIRALIAAVRGRITPDLKSGPVLARDAARATAGDCTTFALAYAALAMSRGIDTRVVTGLRVDGARLIRHRWAVSWTGSRWIAIDAAFGQAPAGGNLIGLAVHDADDAGLVAGEAALTQVRTARWR
jgi:hypothetical protein